MDINPKIPLTYISSIDEQYSKIEFLISILNKNIKLNCKDILINELFFKLVHIHTHYFTQEQITLSKYNYNNLQEIKTIHKQYLDKIVSIHKKATKEHLLFCKETLSFLKNWLPNYFTINAKAINFLKENNVN